MSTEISYTKKTVAEYAERITSAWHKATQSIIEVGKHLLEAETDLSTYEFRALKQDLEDRRIMSASTMSKLKKVAQNAVLTKPDYQELLPPSYETLYKLASVEDETLLEQKIIAGEVNNETQQKDVAIIFDFPHTQTEANTSQNRIVISGDLGSVPNRTLQSLMSVLKKLDKTKGIKISGILLDED